MNLNITEEELFVHDLLDTVHDFGWYSNSEASRFIMIAVKHGFLEHSEYWSKNFKAYRVIKPFKVNGVIVVQGSRYQINRSVKADPPNKFK